MIYIYIYCFRVRVTHYKFIMIFGDKKNSMLPKIARVVKLKEMLILMIKTLDLLFDFYQYLYIMWSLDKYLGESKPSQPCAERIKLHC